MRLLGIFIYLFDFDSLNAYYFVANLLGILELWLFRMAITELHIQD